MSEGMVTIAQALDRNEKRLREIEHKLK
jgi:hypothetical protein